MEMPSNVCKLTGNYAIMRGFFAPKEDKWLLNIRFAAKIIGSRLEIFTLKPTHVQKIAVFI